MCLSQIFNQTNVRRLLTIFSLEKTSNQVFRSQIFQVTKKEIITKDFSLKVTFQFGVQNRQTRFSKLEGAWGKRKYVDLKRHETFRDSSQRSSYIISSQGKQKLKSFKMSHSNS